MAYSDLSDEQLAAAVQNNDLACFTTLIERYENKLANYGRRFLFNHDDVADALQEIFLKAYGQINSFDSSRRFSSWIYRLAHNEFINHTKKRARQWQEILSFDTWLPVLTDQPQPDPVDQKFLRESLQNCLQQIPFNYREVLILFYFQELSYPEISDVLQIPVAAVGVRLNRGKQWLKKNCSQLKIHL